MTRLRHSPAAYLRSLQMSRHQVFAFVEGGDADPFFFGEVCRRACEGRRIGYRVRLAKDLPQGSGGKNALITFYRYARSRGKLFSALDGKTTVLVFFLDKDVDDIKGAMCRSPHVIYTAYYDVENHIFRHADFIRGVSSAASIDPAEVAEHPTFNGNWCEGAVRRWKEWVVLCLLEARCRLPGPSYRCTSQINAPLNGPVDQTRYGAELQAVRARLGLTATQVDQRVGRLSRVVERHLSNGTYDLVFKGKWYATILEHDLRAAFAGRAFRFAGVAGRVAAVMAATLDFSQPWADHFVRPLAALLGGL